MKLMNKYFVALVAVLFFGLNPLALLAQSSTAFEDTMQASGKINVVIGVAFIVLIGIFILLFTLERKLKSLEEKLENK
jgi:nitrogen fixation/metabolism regulation signal transduction histidine kinase